jgi:prolyl-tRNA synthetase
VAGKSEDIRSGAEGLARDLEAAGVRVLIDDRTAVSVGVKFNDAELIGIPTIVIAGRALADGEIEIKDRRTAELRRVPLDAAVVELSH